MGLVGLLGLVSESRGLAQERPTKEARTQQYMPEVRDLFPAETISFSASPPRIVDSEIKCDRNGNIYLVYSDAPEVVLSQTNGVSMLPISKLSLESKSISQYMIPSVGGYRGALRFDFDVGPGGEVYALLNALERSEDKDEARPAFLIVKYKDDGTMDSFFKTGNAPGGHIQPLRFAVFRDGSFLVTGTAVEGERFRTFTALLDRAGTFVTGIGLAHDVGSIALGTSSGDASHDGRQKAASREGVSRRQVTKREAATERARSEGSPVSTVSNGSMVSAPDGNIYLLRATDPPRLYVVSPAGEVPRQFEISSPASGLSPIHMAMAGDDKVFIRFAHVPGTSGENNQVPEYITVVSPQTGEVAAVYRLAGGESDLAACASSPYNFLFVGAGGDGKILQVTRYSPR